MRFRYNTYTFIPLNYLNAVRMYFYISVFRSAERIDVSYNLNLLLLDFFPLVGLWYFFFFLFISKHPISKNIFLAIHLSSTEVAECMSYSICVFSKIALS